MGIRVVMPEKVDTLPVSSFVLYCVQADLDPYESDVNREGNDNARFTCYDQISETTSVVSVCLPPGLYKVDIASFEGGSPLNNLRFTHYGFEATGREIGVVRKMNDDDYIDVNSCNPIHVSNWENKVSVKHIWNPPPIEVPIAGYWSYDTNKCDVVYIVVNGSMQYYCVDENGDGRLATYRSLDVPGPLS